MSVPRMRQSHRSSCCHNADFLKSFERIGPHQYHEIMRTGRSSTPLAYQERPIDFGSYFTWANAFKIVILFVILLIIIFNIFFVKKEDSSAECRRCVATRSMKKVARQRKYHEVMTKRKYVKGWPKTSGRKVRHNNHIRLREWEMV
jgi:hypothetical protein